MATGKTLSNNEDKEAVESSGKNHNNCMVVKLKTTGWCAPQPTIHHIL